MQACRLFWVLLEGPPPKSPSLLMVRLPNCMYPAAGSDLGCNRQHHVGAVLLGGTKKLWILNPKRYCNYGICLYGINHVTCFFGFARMWIWYNIIVRVDGYEIYMYSVLFMYDTRLIRQHSLSNLQIPTCHADLEESKGRTSSLVVNLTFLTPCPSPWLWQTQSTQFGVKGLQLSLHTVLVKVVWCSPKIPKIWSIPIEQNIWVNMMR